MANVNRIPLIVNSTANQIQELPTGDHLQLNDSNKLKIGNSGDLEIFHSSSNSILNDTGTGNLLLQIGGSTIVQTNPSGVVISGICTADSFSGKGITPIGGIIMWSGSVADISNLVGWELCDGSNGTPDLRNRFIVGASNSTGDTTYPGLSPGATGGDADATLVSHEHTTDSIIEPGSNTAKDLSGTINIDSFIATSGNFDNITTGGMDNYINNTNAGPPAGATNKAEYNGNHRHSTDTQGSSATNKNLPPYYSLAYIMRVS